MINSGLYMAQTGAQGREDDVDSEDAVDDNTHAVEVKVHTGPVLALNTFLPPMVQARVLMVESICLKRMTKRKTMRMRMRMRKRKRLMGRRTLLRRMREQRSPGCAS